jgi:hypothetical protein
VVRAVWAEEYEKEVLSMRCSLAVGDVGARLAEWIFLYAYCTMRSSDQDVQSVKRRRLNAPLVNLLLPKFRLIAKLTNQEPGQIAVSLQYHTSIRLSSYCEAMFYVTCWVADNLLDINLSLLFFLS